jgi:hypothetical protein
VLTLEQVTYEAGRSALADQESLVAGVRQRTGTLLAAGYGYLKLREENATKVRRMSWLSGALGVLMMLQTLAWLTSLAID